MEQIEADVTVIGAGITGTSIARELSRYKAETIVVEKGMDIGTQGQTKASGGMIYSGLVMLMSFIVKSLVAPDAPLYDPESQKIRWLEQGFDQAPAWLEELDVYNRPVKNLVIATNKNEVKDLESLVLLGESIGERYSKVKWVDRDMCLETEPHLTEDVIAGLSSEGDAIQVLPWDVAIAQSENAKQNGVRFMLNTRVTGILQKDGYQLVETSQGQIKTRFIVNAGGILADKVSDLAGKRDWSLTFIRNLFVIMDRSAGNLVNTNLCLPPRPGKGPICGRTPEGTLMINIGAYEPSARRNDMGSHPGEALRNMMEAKRYIPELSEKDIIRSFVGMRVFNTRDQEENIIEPLSDNPRFINAVVRLPGLTPAVPIARFVVKLLGEAGMELNDKPDFTPYRKGIQRFRNLSEDERIRLFCQDPRYGHVVCSCETVTEGEIAEAIQRGAKTMTGVRYATRAGMGRCQGNYCSTHVSEILSRELNVPLTQIMERRPGP
ncbi:MAG: FAD-dependent oxidoreductase [Deltaproteobacteria bacterium]|nr:FAD-dependent oxidoreductase [Deltaproteobacteria bacterium]